MAKDDKSKKPDESVDENVETVSFEMPDSLDGLSGTELRALYDQAHATFDKIRDAKVAAGEDLDDETLVVLAKLADNAKVLKAAIKKADETTAERRTQVDEFAAMFDLPGEEGKNGDETETPDGAPADAPTADAPTDAPPAEGSETEAPSEPAGAEAVVASGIDPKDLLRKGVKINVPLDEVRRRQDAKRGGPAKELATITAAAGISGIEPGGRIGDIRGIARAMHERARNLPANGSAGRVPIASIHREFEHTIGLDASPEEAWEIVKRASDPQSLVAAGGWCAPSVVIYDFFNIAAAEQLLDLPTVNAARGGIRFPTSLSISDFLDDIWLWTETNDIQAATGSGTKPCARPPCPTFNEERLAMHGYCVTAGNLTEWAYPELIDNFIALTVAAHGHVVSNRHIAIMVAGSTAVTGTGTGGLAGAVAPILDNIELQAVDYRIRYRMRWDSVLEAVFPVWTYAVIRADIAKRNGYSNPFQVTDAEIRSWFDLRGIRAQFVIDWQVGAGAYPGQATPATDWPSNVQFMIYAAGTWVQGTGPTINLGVQRDSTLNAKNDHTAAWSEEGTLVAKIGHDSRVVTVPIDPDGVTGLQADLSASV